MKKTLFLLANGFEELEFVAPYDILHRGGVETKTASISGKKEVEGAHGLAVLADSLLQQVNGLPFDLLVLPGGGLGTENLFKSDSVKNLLIKSYEAGKTIAAICAAPTVLANAGILKKHEATSYPSVKDKVEPNCKRYLDAPVVISENIVTSKGAGTAAEFGFCLLSLFAGLEAAEDVKGKIFYISPYA
jgi:4-methyl-5(b-hydroxyethyl)-thiazole monophosphate biosynthesis